jgi:hypothetical protein
LLIPLAASLFLSTVVSATVELPAGETHLKRPMELPNGGVNITLQANPSGSTLVLDPDFKGVAAIVALGVSDLTLAGFTIRGNREDLKSTWELPPDEKPFADFFSDNGIVIRKSSHVTIRGIKFDHIKAFPVIVNVSSDITIDSVRIEDSGTLKPNGRNNTSGGILLEQGVLRFEVRGCEILRVTGNAIWTHSYASAPRSSDGWIHGNTISDVSRDAIQVGHATRVRVEDNTGSNLGYPIQYVDVETQAVAVALDTSGEVDQSVYARNRFTDVNGQCIDLDGFHDGSVTGNSCVNRKPIDAYPVLHEGIVFGNNNLAGEPRNVLVTNNTIEGFAYGAVFLVGSNNRIERNSFLDMNRARCGSSPTPARCAYALDQPDLLRAGIYLGNRGGRPSTPKGNVIRANTISGFGMKAHCVAAAAGVSLAANTIEANVCSDR